MFENLKIAIVHDELTRRGGAEMVLEEMVRMWPTADVYALYAGEPVMVVDHSVKEINTSPLQKLPRWFRRHPSRLVPLLPYAAEQLDLSKYDLVVSSTSGFAKAIVTRAGIPHVSYCHTPTRYLWDDRRAVRDNLPKLKRWMGALAQHFLRVSDLAAAARVDYFIANSEWTRARIGKYYRQDARVVHPPVDTDFYCPGPGPMDRSDYFLIVSRLSFTKNIHQAIEAVQKLKKKLLIVGVGRDSQRLKRLAGDETEFTGKVSREELRELYRGATAVLQTGVEDFGIATAEAQACGTPVVALAAGGASEVVLNGETGILYRSQTVSDLANAMKKIQEMRRPAPDLIQRQAWKFSKYRFRENLEREISGILAEKYKIGP